MIQLADATVLVNNESVGVTPNSVKFTEGKGEQQMKAVSIGGGAVEQLYSHNVESNFSKVMFEVPATVENINLLLDWKTNRNTNVVTIIASNPDGDITRTFQKAALLGDYEVEIGSDTAISVEFSTDAAI